MSARHVTRTAVILALAAIAGSALIARGPLSVSTGNQLAPDWPAITHQTRPWTRWWWMGSAVDEAGLTTELESIRAAGLGGVEITPIYGVSGAEARFIPYLSDAWMRALEHTLREARRLDLGADLATGTGWPFGGPWVRASDASRTLAYRRWPVEGGHRLTERVGLEQPALVRAIGKRIGELKEPVEANPNLQALALEQVRYRKPLPLQALVAYSSTGDVVDLTRRVGSDGVLDWVAPAGTWTLYGVFLGWHGKLVERAAPGGEGNVIDHFSRDAIRDYLARFDRAFSRHRLDGLRAFFNDSYEVDDAQGQADGTPLLFEEFARRRGYDLRRHLPALFGAGKTEQNTRVVADYGQTISELLLDTFTTEWRTWAQRRGAIVRNQAHGSPANLLDLYAASDIPETEGEEISRFKWAASAAHVAGRPLIAAEAATWLGEHFRSTLADVRAAVDRFFVAGVNHIVYHGTAYSPPDDPWPGWLFYASVEFNSRNSWWADFAALNQYVTRVQSFLQAGTPDHDVLVYYPFYDTLAAGGAGRLAHFGGANTPADGTAFEAAATTLQRRGFTHDFVSDRQLDAVRVSGGTLVTSGGGSYKTLVLPVSRFVPLETFERIVALARDGAVVLAFRGLPDDVAGYGDLAARRQRFHAVRDGLRFSAPDAAGVREARLDRGVVLQGDDLEPLLARANVSREALVDRGLQLARRRYNGGRYYFIANDGERQVDDWIPLDDRAPAAVVFDPMTGRRGDAETRRSAAGMLDVRLTIPRNSSLIVTTASAPIGERFPAFDPVGAPIDVRGPWQVRFVAGGPQLPRARSVDRLASWTTFGGDEARQFSGTAVYAATFAKPSADAAAWLLDLGRVRESARVNLNGRDLGTAVGPDFRLTVDAAQLAATNELEVYVSNLMANRIAALDKAGVGWRKFYNVNFPARLAENRGPDGLFTAARWEPLESGLLGPVMLTPLRLR
jgi:hypothetical protein